MDPPLADKPVGTTVVLSPGAGCGVWPGAGGFWGGFWLEAAVAQSKVASVHVAISKGVFIIRSRA